LGELNTQTIPALEKKLGQKFEEFKTKLDDFMRAIYAENNQNLKEKSTQRFVYFC